MNRDMENRDISRELEEMRSQMAILKEKLESQRIVNEQQLRNSTTKKMSKIDKRILTTIILGINALVYCTWYFTTRMQLSVAFTIATISLMVVCLAITIYKHHAFRRIDLSRGNVLDVVERLTKIRKHYNEWWKTAVPILLVWYGWWMYELLTIYTHESYIRSISVGSCVGVVVGLIAGYKINNKIVNEADEIVEQIRELQKMK